MCVYLCAGVRKGGGGRGVCGHACTMGCQFSFVNSVLPFLLYVRLNLSCQVLYQVLFISPAPCPS